MKKINSIIFIILLALSATGQSKRDKNTRPVTDTSSFNGIYTGILPCSDCLAIVYRLEVKQDRTFLERSIYHGRSAKPTEYRGLWTIKSDGTLVLLTDDGDKYLKKHEKGLLLLDEEGNIITGEFADKYILNRVKEITNSVLPSPKPDRNLIKWREGYNFYAWGNDPSWELDMDFDKAFRFLQGDDKQFSAPAVAAEKMPGQGTAILVYRTKTEAGEMIITTVREKCEDKSSGEQSGYRTSVQLKTLTDTTFSKFEGCGAYVADLRLNNVWMIRKAGNTEVKSEEFANEMPRLELKIKEGRVIGSDGCNTFSGSIKVEENRITFGSLSTTKMACENMAISNRILSSINGKTLEFSFGEKFLQFSENGDPVLILQNGN